MADPMTQPWTDADVELAAGRLWEQDERFWSAVHRVPWTDADADEQVQYRAKAVEILSALAAAGRLTPGPLLAVRVEGRMYHPADVALVYAAVPTEEDTDR